jgi:hypothetical protein
MPHESLPLLVVCGGLLEDRGEGKTTIDVIDLCRGQKGALNENARDYNQSTGDTTTNPIYLQPRYPSHLSQHTRVTYS